MINIEQAGEYYDSLIFARGHHDSESFDRALKNQGYADLYDCNNHRGMCRIDRSFVAHHGYARITPDSTGEYSHIFYLCKPGRGAFPVTYVGNVE